MQPFFRAIAARASKITARTRWSIIDQILISGVNVTTGILLVRVLGLREYGIYTIVLIAVQFFGTIQVAGIVAPMMSIFDQRGNISQSSYLVAVLLHQSLFCAFTIGILVSVMTLSQEFVSVVMPIKIGVAATLLVATQFQDLARRFFYVTERPIRAFLCDLIAYGARILLIISFALAGTLTLDGVWTATIAASFTALLVLVPDLIKLDVSWTMIKSVTKQHSIIAGWMVGDAVAAWFSNSFFFVIIGTVLGPVQLGGVRAVQNLISVTNLLLQALENFVPSAATKALLSGGAPALLRYVIRISLVGAAGITVVAILLMLFANPIMLLVYKRTFADQLAILAIFGALYAMAHVNYVVASGLRSLGLMRQVFWSQAIIGVGSVAVAWYVAKTWGVIGTLSAQLFARMLMTGQIAFILRIGARSV